MPILLCFNLVSRQCGYTPAQICSKWMKTRQVLKIQILHQNNVENLKVRWDWNWNLISFSNSTHHLEFSWDFIHVHALRIDFSRCATTDHSLKGEGPDAHIWRLIREWKRDTGQKWNLVQITSYSITNFWWHHFFLSFLTQSLHL